MTDRHAGMKMNEYKNFDRFFGLDLEDDLSREILHIIIKYRLSDDEPQFVDRIIKACKLNWSCYEIQQEMKKRGCNEIILYGAGHDGIINKKVLDLCNVPVRCFCDRSASRKSSLYNDIVTISDDELAGIMTDSTLIVISSRHFRDEIHDKLISEGIDENNILLPKYGILYAGCFDQYFDVFEPVNDEVFIDGGANLGETSRLFAKWSAGRYKKIHAFEPVVEETDALYIKKLRNVDWHKSALWDKEEPLSVVESNVDSYIHTAGTIEQKTTVVPGVTLDSVIANDPDLTGSQVTFIKYDLEGSEMQALRGAAKTIMRDRPRLAISVYHKQKDIFEIPEYIKSLVPEYRMWLRHYSTNYFETILYCSI